VAGALAPLPRRPAAVGVLGRHDRRLALPRPGRPAPTARLIAGTQGLDTVVQGTPQENLFVITSGHYETSPSHVLEAPRMSEVLAQLHERFQFIVFDSAPVNVYTDAQILGARVDATVFVIEADRTRVDEVQRAKRQLERGGAKMLGVLLNRRKNYLPTFLEGMI